MIVSRQANPGFSLVELLVTLGLMATLMAFTLVGLNKMTERSKAAQCVGSLKYCGAALSIYIGENNGVYKNWMAGTTEYANYWTWYLRYKGGYTTEDLAARRCHSADFGDNPANLGGHYGFYTEDPYGQRSTPASGTTIYEIRMATHPNPASAPMLADSLKEDGKIQMHTIRKGSGTSRGGFHARHSGRVNVFFVDGHIEPVSPSRFRELNVDQIFSEEGEIVITPTK